MTREEALVTLRELAHLTDKEDAHMSADNVLLQLIDDREITEAFNAIDKWYA